jgi:hypothetical protein
MLALMAIGGGLFWRARRRGGNLVEEPVRAPHRRLRPKRPPLPRLLPRFRPRPRRQTRQPLRVPGSTWTCSSRRHAFR